MAHNGDHPVTKDDNRIIAVTVADAIRERLIAYTPVTSAHQALVLAYTRRQYCALLHFIREYELDVDVQDITRSIDRALETEFVVPDL